MSNREVAIKVRVAERAVNRQKQALIADGRFKVLPPPPKALAAPTSAPASEPEQAGVDKALWDLKRTLVDEALLKGHSNGRIAVAAGVGRTFIRVRRKILLASGRLKPGRLVSVAA